MALRTAELHESAALLDDRWPGDPHRNPERKRGAADFQLRWKPISSLRPNTPGESSLQTTTHKNESRLLRGVFMLRR